MSSITEIETAFATYLRDVLPGRRMIRAKVGEAPAPSGPATLWDLARAVPSDNPVTTFEDENQIVTSTDTMLDFTVTMLGGDAMSDAMRVSNGLRATQRTADLYRVCGLWGVEPPQDLSALETGTIRARAEFRVTLSAPIESVFARETIDTQQVTINEPAQQYDATFTIEAPPT